MDAFDSMTPYQQLLQTLPASPKSWLITGVAGFIGSNLLEAVIKLDRRVVGLDNFATGYQHNLDEVQSLVTAVQLANFKFIQGDLPHSQADIGKAQLLLGYSTKYLLAEGVAARCHVFGLAVEQLAGGLVDDLFLVVGEDAHHRQTPAAPLQEIDHGAELAARGVAELIIGLEDQIANDAHGAGTGRVDSIELLRCSCGQIDKV